MPLHLSLCEIDTHTDLSCIQVEIGDIRLRSVPQLISDHFRDLKANAFFLSKRELAAIFVGGHALVGLTYHPDDRVAAEAVPRAGGEAAGMQGDFLLDQGSAFLDGMLSALEYVLVNSLLARESIIARVNDDIAAGVYNQFLRTV